MGNTVQSIGLVRPAQRAGWAVFLACLLPLGCGGRSQDAANGGAGHSGANGGGPPGGAAEGGEGGADSTSLGGSGVGGNDSIITFAGAPPAAGAAGDACDEKALWVAIDLGFGGVGYCEIAPIPTPNEQTGVTRGAVTINEGGLVIDNTGLAPHEKKVWLDGLSNERWTCLAGQTIGYKCSVAG